MKAKKSGNKFIVRIDRGGEIIETLKQFCRDNYIKPGTVQGIGAANKAVIGLFDVETKKYHSTMNGEVYLHIHANLCDSENDSLGGHLNSAVVSATFEAII